MAASLVQKEEPQNNDQGCSQELSDPHEFEETDDSTETDDDDEDDDDEGDDDDDDEGEDEDEDEDKAGDEDENRDDDDTSDNDDDEVVDNGHGHDENVEGIITKTDSSTDSTERNSLLRNDNDKETNL